MNPAPMIAFVPEWDYFVIRRTWYTDIDRQPLPHRESHMHPAAQPAHANTPTNQHARSSVRCLPRGTCLCSPLSLSPWGSRKNFCSFA
jgi:hypothetical protein